MDTKNPEFQAAFREVVDDRRGDHVAPERLVAHHHGLLAGEEADAVEEHIAACRQCADLLLELVAFEDDEAGEAGEDGVAGQDDGVADFETEADWRALRRRLQEEEPSAPARRPASARPQPVSRPYAAWGLAASVLLSVGLGAWVVQLQGELKTARTARFNFPLVSLEPDGLTRGGVEEGHVECAGDWAVVLLNPRPVFVPNVEHRLEIVNASGQVLWSREGLLPIDSSHFSVGLPCPLLAPGTYRARLLRDGAEPEVFEFQVDR